MSFKLLVFRSVSSTFTVVRTRVSRNAAGANSINQRLYISTESAISRFQPSGLPRFTVPVKDEARGRPPELSRRERAIALSYLAERPHGRPGHIVPPKLSTVGCQHTTEQASRTRARYHSFSAPNCHNSPTTDPPARRSPAPILKTSTTNKKPQAIGPGLFYPHNQGKPPEITLPLPTPPRRPSAPRPYRSSPR
jgi:hypothetical protein